MDFFVSFNQVDFMLVLLMYEFVFFPFSFRYFTMRTFSTFVENCGRKFPPINSFLFFLNKVFDPINEYL